MVEWIVNFGIFLYYNLVVKRNRESYFNKNPYPFIHSIVDHQVKEQTNLF